MDGNKSTFSIVCCFQCKEFVLQKSLSADEVVFGESMDEILDKIWGKALSFIKREVIATGDDIQWNVNLIPERDQIGNFIVFQDRTARKCYTVDQVNSTLLSRLRNKHVNSMIHVYRRQVCNKSVHGKFVAKLLQPEQRDRANANNTQSLMIMVEELKQKHGDIFPANISVWQMWENSIHSARAHLQEEMTNKRPTPHLIHLFV